MFSCIAGEFHVHALAVFVVVIGGGFFFVLAYFVTLKKGSKFLGRYTGWPP